MCHFRQSLERRGASELALRRVAAQQAVVRDDVVHQSIESVVQLPATLRTALLACVLAASSSVHHEPRFRVLVVHTEKHDRAHVSFDREADAWFAAVAVREGITVDTTSDWFRLTDSVLSRYRVLVFLDTRPESASQRAAFRRYMAHGGAWMGFHFAGFALTPSDVPANWPWYHDTLIGAGQYVSNTWRPTAAILLVEDASHPVTRGLPRTFRSQPNEWYRWERDLRANPDIDILLAIDSSSFPLGTGPKPDEIWHIGFYPVVWTNRKYRMVYFNMGHNDMDYEHRYGTSNRTLSHTFGNPVQDQLILNALLWLGDRHRRE